MSRIIVSESNVLKRYREKKSSKELTQDLGDASTPHSIYCLIKNRLSGKLAVNKAFLRKGNVVKCLRCVK